MGKKHSANYSPRTIAMTDRDLGHALLELDAASLAGKNDLPAKTAAILHRDINPVFFGQLFLRLIHVGWSWFNE